MGVIGRSLGRTRERLSGALQRILPARRPDEAALEALEQALIEADVGPSTATRLVAELRAPGDSSADPRTRLRTAMLELLAVAEGPGNGGQTGVSADAGLSASKPSVILMVGVNGSGKTTSTAKLGALYRGRAQSVIFGAADTFRAAAVEQLEAWGERLDVAVVAHQAGGDPAAVVYDTCESARARAIDVAIIDTAGRLHTKDNLMAELAKIRRAAGKVVEGAPHEVLLVLDATTGQNGLRQAEDFLERAGVTGLILAKLDGSARGGVALSIAAQLRLPIRYVGTGEDIHDLAPFNAEAYVDGLLGEDV